MKAFDRKFGADFWKAIPAGPGVYLYSVGEGGNQKVIYVGKAKNLRRRLGQYRNAKRLKAHWKMRKVVSEATHLEFRSLDSELQASLEEVRLIQELKPRWNEASTYYRLYPFWGWRRIGNSATYLFILTQQPELFPDFELHGCFRSRAHNQEAFEGLGFLLQLVGKPIRARKLEAQLKLPRNLASFAVQGLPEDWLESFAAFLTGERKQALEELLLTLLEMPGSRRMARDSVQEAFDALKRFYRHEARPLRDARKFDPTLPYPIPQRDRDPLFIRRTRREPRLDKHEASV